MSSEQVAVITGASSWVGHGVARRLADRGLSLVLAARHGEVLDRLADECRDAGSAVVCVRTDVSKDGEAALIARRAVDAFGGFDIWINNAGVGAGGPINAAPALDDEAIVRTNLLGTLHGSQEAMIQFRRTRYGVLINLAAAPGRIPAPYYAACAASRFGIIGLGAALREELHDAGLDGVRVCTVMPSALGTLGRPGGPGASTLRRSADRNGTPRDGDTDEIAGAPAGVGRVAALIAHLIDQPRDEVVADATPRPVPISRISGGRTRLQPVSGAHLDSTPLRAAAPPPSGALLRSRTATGRMDAERNGQPGSVSASTTPGRLAGVGASQRDEPGESRPKGGA